MVKRQKYKFSKWVVPILSIVLLLTFLIAPHVFASDVVENNILEDIKDDGEGCGVYMILNFIIEIITYGIAIAGAIGIVVTGIIWLTAKGSEEQVTKAKRRFLDIIIGLMVYIILWAILSLVLPGGILNGSTQCAAPGDADKRSGLFNQEMQERQISSDGSDKRGTSNQKNAAIRAKIASTAIKFAWPYSKWHNNTSILRKAPAGYMKAFESTTKKWEKQLCKKKGWCDSSRLKGMSCSSFGSTVVRVSAPKQNKKYPKGFPTPSQKVYTYLKNSKKWKKIPLKKVEPGDIDIQSVGGEGRHTAVIVSGKGKKCTSAEASNGWSYGRINKKGNHPARGRTHNFYRYIGT